MARKGRRSSNEERMNAIRLLQQGYTRAQVADILDVAESSVYDWQAKFREGGLAALSTKIASGRKSLLSDKQLIQLYKWLRGNPRQVQFDFGLWTRKVVRELIRREFGIDYTPQNVGKILKSKHSAPPADVLADDRFVLMRSRFRRDGGGLSPWRGGRGQDAGRDR